MNIYEPYTEADAGDSLLHLKVTYEEKLEGSIINRILPLLVLIVLFLIYVITNPSYTEWFVGGMVFVVVSLIIILQTKKGMDLYFHKDAIMLETHRILGRKNEKILLNEIDFIDAEVYHEPRISGAFYRLVLKNKKRILLLRSSGIYGDSEEKLNALNAKLESITGLQIHHDWKGI